MKKQLRGGRINRVNPLIQQIISNEFLRNSESIINKSTITHVSTSPDMKRSTIYVSNIENNKSQLITALEKNRSKIQKELANRFVKSSKSSKLSIQSQMFCDIETLFDIPPEAFDPEPKVNSTVIKITPHNRYQKYIPHYSNFKKVLTICFANPRKKIATALKNINVDVSKLSFDINSRAEELEINDYFEILMQYESQI